MKLIHHTWSKITGSGLLKHAECVKCKSHRYYDYRFQKMMYQDRFGNLFYRTPECVFMNEKL